MTQTHERLTLEDIAAEINVSRTTIYKIINNKGTVSEKTKAKVLAALEKYNYVPNNNARSLAMNKKYEIVLIDFNSSNASYFVSSIERGIGQAIRDYGDYGLIIHHYTSPVNTPADQKSYIHEAYEKGIRHFIIAVANKTILLPELDFLQENHCVVILLSKDIPDAACNAFIGIDEYKSGKLAAELMGKMLPDGGKLQILLAGESYSNLATIQTRYHGFVDKIQDFPQIELLPAIHNISNNVQLSTELDTILEIPDLKAIFDLTCQLEFISQFLQAKKRTSLKLVGIDLFPEIKSFIADNTIDAIIFQNLEAQTVLACKLLFENLCYGKPIKKDKFYSKLEIIMSENLEYFIEE